MSAAAFLAPHARVTVLEAEAMLSYHASGRSAALYTECYGPGIVPALTAASRAFLADRDAPLVTARGALFVADDRSRARIEDLTATFSRTVPDLEAFDDSQCRTAFPVLDPTQEWSGLYEPGAMDLDVHGLETVYRSIVTDHGGRISLRSPVRSMRRRGETWRIDIPDGEIEADVVVNAAGAWGDDVARRASVDPLGLTPLRRSAFLAAAPDGARGWPMVIDANERWYCKPEGPNLLGSAADEVPSDPVDATPEMEEVALAIERINASTTLGIRSVRSTWAGLRTFTPDRLPAVGPDPAEGSFVWCVGQGGYGVKTSPAIGELVAGLVLERAVPDRLAEAGVTAAALDPARVR